MYLHSRDYSDIRVRGPGGSGDTGFEVLDFTLGAFFYSTNPECLLESEKALGTRVGRKMAFQSVSVRCEFETINPSLTGYSSSRSV